MRRLLFVWASVMESSIEAANSWVELLELARLHSATQRRENSIESELFPDFCRIYELQPGRIERAVYCIFNNRFIIEVHNIPNRHRYIVGNVKNMPYAALVLCSKDDRLCDICMMNDMHWLSSVTVAKPLQALFQMRISVPIYKSQSKNR